MHQKTHIYTNLSPLHSSSLQIWKVPQVAAWPQAHVGTLADPHCSFTLRPNTHLTSPLYWLKKHNIIGHGKCTYTFTASHNQSDWSRHMLYHSLSCWCAQSINILYTPAWIRASSPGCDGHQTITHTQATRDTHTLSLCKKHTELCKHCILKNMNQCSSVKFNCGFHTRWFDDKII